ncbi:MAG: hypothetical protein ACI9N9_001099 [Enterobacterales bacterium]|jgi:hypothetical protein
MANLSPIVDTLKSKTPARLMPTLASSKAEERATSCLLASFMVIPNFAQAVLKQAGAPSGKRLRSQCFTEVVFNDDTDDEQLSRPDGLIIVTNGVTTWTALVEAKVGNNPISGEQVERYLDLAKKHKVDALITISNQYAPSENILPYNVKANKLRSVSCTHYSWHSILATAILVSADKVTNDVEQSFILDDLVNFLDHPNSGISAMSSLHKDWKVLCEDIHSRKPISKASLATNNAVNSWLQQLRSSGINLSKAIHQPIEIYLNNEQKKDPSKLLKSFLDEVSTDHILSAEYIIPNAAGRIKFSADIVRRSLETCIRIDAPRDVSRQTAAVNWLTRQLKKTSSSNIIIRAYWPKRIPMTAAPLVELFEKPELLLPESKEMPKAFEVVLSTDLQGKFKQVKTIVDESNKLLIQFYVDAGQHINNWVPKAPKVLKTKILNVELTHDELSVIENNSDDLSGVVNPNL